ncbi:hypothetical protein CGCA056_v013842 [Colletotrichum aenigma]|uniref:uncharacterized protein n=1 Tax=Colletotrichum aenigma TaxID=1215731 RepID=UPI00187311BE|nr:uncharacterized protein CGCA056_v013842 [Colletotrichum aenigma]KAF5507163.1 hypothetical protein CGCA056_v013842 [Colletotrichum aenigma]
MVDLDEAIPALNQRPAALAIIIVFLILAYVCGTGRLYIRFFVVRRPGWDDALLIMVLTFYICNAAYCMATTFIKLALLCQYLTMFDHGSLSYRISMVMLIITAMWGTAYSVIAWFPCNPVSAQWELTKPATGRWGFGSDDLGVYKRTYISHVATNMILDMVVCGLPLPFAWGNGIRKRSVYGVVSLFILGDIVVAIGVSRLVSIQNTEAGTYPRVDPSWYACVPAVLATVEVNLATVCASIPIVWPVTQRALSRIWVTREVEITSEPGDYPLTAGVKPYDSYYIQKTSAWSITSQQHNGKGM